MGPVRTSRLTAHLINNPPTPAQSSSKISKQTNSSLKNTLNEDSLAPIGIPLRRSTRTSIGSPQTHSKISTTKTTNNSDSAFTQTTDLIVPLPAANTANTSKKVTTKKTTSKRKVKEVTPEEETEEELERVELKNGLVAAETNGAPSVRREAVGGDSIIEESILTAVDEEEEGSRRGKRSRTGAAVAATKQAPSTSRGVAVRRLIYPLNNDDKLTHFSSTASSSQNIE